MVELIAAWGATGRRAAVYRGHRTSQALAPHAFKGIHQSLDEQEQERVRLAVEHERLLDLANTIQMMCSIDDRTSRTLLTR